MPVGTLDINPSTVGQDMTVPKISRVVGGQKKPKRSLLKHSKYGETTTTTTIVQQQVKHSVNGMDDSGYYAANEVEEDEEMYDMGPQKHNDQSKADQGYDANQKINLVDFQKEPIKQKKFKCEQCPKAYGPPNGKYQLKAHVEAAHDKIKRFKCEECDYASARKGPIHLSHMTSTNI